MSSGNDNLGRVLGVALALCIVCSVIVSTAAVLLKPQQEANKTLDLKRNILMAAGLYEPEVPVEVQFERVTTKVIDLDTGRYTEDDPFAFDPRAAAKDPSLSKRLVGTEDLAKIQRRANKALVYLVNNDAGELEKVILPVHGYGLWSTLYGFVALESDANTIAGLGFYEHAETPGLGGEIDNPRWKAMWPEKKVFKDGEVAISVIKGAVNPDGANADWQVDGLSGATLTSKGVHNLLRYWLGQDGYQPYLNNVREGDV